MKKVLQVGKDVKARRAKVKKLMGLSFASLGMDVRLELIQELIPLGLMHVGEVLQQEVEALAGKRYERDGLPGHVRWGRQDGSVYLGDQKLPISYPRVRNVQGGYEVPLVSYKALQEPRHMDDGLMKKILLGLSSRRYKECSEAIPESFGLSPSTVSRRFIKASEKRLRVFMERRLDDLNIVAIIIDGKTFQDDEMILVLGVLRQGKKVILGFIQSGTENTTVCKAFLNDLLERGLKVEAGLLCVMDGSRGIRKAVEDVLGRSALVQRCQWHKRENVLRYLPKHLQAKFRRALQQAYEQPTYAAAKETLQGVKKALRLINESAVRSLEEGLEETLTLHKLGLFQELGRSLKTSNCIESLMSLIGQKLDKVDHWKNSNQKQRWLAAALLDIEPRLNKICGYRHLPQLVKAIQRELRIEPASGKEGVAA